MFQAVGAEVVAVQRRRRDLCAWMIALEDELVLGQGCSTRQAVVKDTQRQGVEAVVNLGQREELERREWREEVDEDLGRRSRVSR